MTYLLELRKQNKEIEIKAECGIYTRSLNTLLQMTHI